MDLLSWKELEFVLFFPSFCEVVKTINRLFRLLF